MKSASSVKKYHRCKREDKKQREQSAEKRKLSQAERDRKKDFQTSRQTDNLWTQRRGMSLISRRTIQYTAPGSISPHTHAHRGQTFWVWWWIESNSYSVTWKLSESIESLSGSITQHAAHHTRLYKTTMPYTALKICSFHNYLTRGH